MYHIHFNRWKPSEKLTALLAVLLASLTILLRTVPGVSFSANLCLLCMVACLGLLFLSRMGQRRQGWKILLRIALAALALLVIALAAVEFWVIRTGQRDDAAKPADAVIVLGPESTEPPLPWPANPHRRGGSLPESKPRHSGGAVRRAWAGREYLRGAGNVQRPDGAGH